MLSEMAAEDIRHLAGKGIALSPAQIVRLNDLALKITRGRHSADFIHAARVAWVGDDLLLREPTVRMEIWVRDVAAEWWAGHALQLAVAWASAHCAISGWFDQWDGRKKADRELTRWANSLACTGDQLFAALEYVIVGEDRTDTEPERDPPDGCPFADTLAEAVAAGLGLPVADLESMPVRILGECVRRWTRNRIALAGGRETPDARSRFREVREYEDYVAELEKGSANAG